jgi:opacity protein-like surface antigen
MKKLLFLFCLMFISASAFAQQGKMTCGVHGNFGVDGGNLGLGGNFGYEFIKNLRGVAEFNYFAKMNNYSSWEAEGNIDYLLKLGDDLTFYPLAGISYASVTHYSDSESKVGLNVGTGLEYTILKELSLKVEFNYKTQKIFYKDPYKYLIKFGVVFPL